MSSKIFIGSRHQAYIFLRAKNNSTVTVHNVQSHVKSFSPLFDGNKTFIYNNPSSEEIKLISTLVDKNMGEHCLLFDDESFDGRISLIQKIRKSNSVYNFSYPVLGDTTELKRRVLQFTKTLEIEIDNNCFDWISQNCPIFRIKSKESGSKKESLTYDIELLFQELYKISSYTDKITLEELQNSNFNTDSDIFMFIDQILNKKLNEALVSSQLLMSSMGEQGMLLILLNQLLFLLHVSQCKEERIYNTDDVLKRLENRDLIGKYLSESWELISVPIKSQNPTRVRIEISKDTYSTIKLSKMINFVVDTIKDLRNHGNKNIAMFLLLNKMQIV
jgi:hypothetical protein